MKRIRILVACAALGLGWATVPARAEAREKAHAQALAHAPHGGATVPVQTGKASYYGREFNGRRMSNGRRFDPRSNSAAHQTLPLGTTARVTNLENGRSQTVIVEDRGPRARGRILDVSPRTAEQLGMREQDVMRVEVAPVTIPRSGGDADPGGADGGGRGGRVRR